MTPEITSVLALLIALSSLIIALYALFSPAIRSATRRIKTPGTIEFPESPAPDQIHTSALLESGLAPVLPGLGAGLLDCTDFGPHCAAWFLYPEEEGKKMAAVTCFASSERSPEFFERAVNLAREQFTSVADLMHYPNP